MTLATIAQMPASCTAAAVARLDMDSASDASVSADTSLELTPELLTDSSHLDGSQKRTRLRKRHGNYVYFHNNLHESTTALEWLNPCGGIYSPMTSQQADTEEGTKAIQMQRLPVRHYMKLLRRSTGFEFRTLNDTLTTIDISDMEMWKLHQYHYKFLPTLKRNSSIALKRWYRNMQTFVASFAYLGRTQYKWDHSKLLHASKTSVELSELLMSARRLLCEIETAINGSYPLNSQEKLTAIDRHTMNKRLKFRTRRHDSETLVEVDTIDLKYLKHYYYDYLYTMGRILRKNLKHRGQIVLQENSEQSVSLTSRADEPNASSSVNLSPIVASSSSSASESMENTSQENKQAVHRRKKQQRHQQHQQRLHKAHSKSAELPEFE